MIRFATVFLMLFSFIFPHWMQDPAGGVTGPSGTNSVSVDAHTYFAAGTLSGCTNGGTSCQISTTVSVPTNGDAVAVKLFTCSSGGACAGTPGNYTLSDGGTNTYTLIGPASVLPGNGTQGILEFVACGATAGTYTLTASASGGDQFNFSFAEVISLKGAHATGCVDTNISTQVSAVTGSSISLTSPGNVAKTGEVAVASFHCGSGASTSNTGTYATLDSNSSDSSLIADSVNPTNGATTTAAATCSISAVHVGNLVSIQP